MEEPQIWRSPEEEETNGNNINEARDDDNQGKRNEQQWRKHYGDERSNRHTEDEGIVRITTVNINSFPKLGTPKFLRMQEELQSTDCVGMSELNRNWLKIPAQESIYNRTKHWWPHQKIKVAWLQEPKWHSTYQQGGVSLALTTNKLAKFGQAKGEDESGLGRWVWHTMEGHSNTKTAIIQVYKPVRNIKDNGSTYMQQRAATSEEDPRKLFDNDLIQMTDEFIEQGYQIIIMGDMNTQLEGRSQLEKELKDRGINDVIRDRYREDAPGTHKRGTTPIDGIFASETLIIARGGYDGGKEELSDHRMLWADFTMDSLLGIDRGDLVKPKAKKLQATNDKRVRRFNQVLLSQIRMHKLVEKAQKLEEDIGENRAMTGGQKRRYEQIDNQRCRAVEHAEKECAKSHPNKMEFSVELREAMGRTILWSLIQKKQARRKRVHTRWVIETKQRLHITEHITVPETIEETKAIANAAWEDFKAKKAKAPELRKEFLDLLLEQAEAVGDTRKAKDIRQIKEREQTREVHARIKMARGKLRGSGVRFIHRTTETGATETIKNKYDMEHEIVKANESKLQAANESPARQGELGEILTDHDYEKWEKLLHGELHTEEHAEAGMKKWLEYFTNITIEEEDIALSTDDYVKSWQPVKEHTSCAPGALHFGVFKTMHACRPAAELHAIMARIPINTGYTPQRWTQCVDSMLPKKKNEWRPSKLRLTSLLMPDYNHNNKILGRAAMRAAERKKLLAPEQYGSRKKLSAAKHALNKRLLLDILRIQRRPGVICANDAKAAYDRILHLAAYVSLRRVGIKKEATISMLEPIRRMQHKIRTAYGDSNIGYGGTDWERDPSGICQGNGAGPAIWALVSSPLLDILRQAGYGAKLHTAIGKTFFHLSGFAFVDDADTIQTGYLGEHTATLMGKAQEELELWESLVRATGGGIAGDKSDFVAINFEWNEGKWKYEKKDNNNKLTVFDGQQAKEQLKQLDVSTARRTLGVWQAADGNEEKQTEKLVEKAKEWARSAARSSLSRSDVIVGIKTSLYPSITYGMVATTLSEAQCQEIFKPIRTAVLPKAGYCRNIPTVVLHGPECLRVV